MDRTTVLQEIRKMRFEETWNEWKKGRLARKKRDGFRGRAGRRILFRKQPGDDLAMGCDEDFFPCGSPFQVGRKMLAQFGDVDGRHWGSSRE